MVEMSDFCCGVQLTSYLTHRRHFEGGGLGVVRRAIADVAGTCSRDALVLLTSISSFVMCPKHTGATRPRLCKPVMQKRMG
jgi:hypothetical protein